MLNCVVGLESDESTQFRADACGNSHSHDDSVAWGGALFLGDWFYRQVAAHSALGAAWPGPSVRPHGLPLVARHSGAGVFSAALLDDCAGGTVLGLSACAIGFDEHRGSRNDWGITL